MEQQSLDGSGDSIGKKQRKFELDLLSVCGLSGTDIVQQVDRIQVNSPQVTDYIKSNRTAIIDLIQNQTKPAVQDTLERLRQKRLELESWIKTSFEVDDLDQQIYLLNAKRRFSEMDDTSVGVDQSKKTAEEKPKLRLKLSTTETATAAGIDTTPAPTGGRGAKNLGRMSRVDPQQPDLKPKVPNQVPVTTFWNFIEPFFKRIDENDVRWLDDPNRIIDPTPFTIPPLGRHYLEQWREQYGYVTSTSGIRPLCVPNVVGLKERLLSMLLPVDDKFDIDLDQTDLTDTLPTPPSESYPTSLDNRLRRELADAGLLDYPSASKDHQEDDDLCQELRRLQHKLRECAMLNQYRKRRLAALVRTRVLPAQELYHLVDEIDKQLCGLYVKAMRNRKKGASAKKATSGADNASAECARLVSNRAKLLQAFGDIIGPRLVYLGTTATSERLFDPSTEARLLQDAKQLGMWYLE